MKRSTIIMITIITYLISLVGMFFGVDEYIKSKDQRLRADIHNKIAELFSGRDMYVDIAYSDYKVGYERVDIPSKPKSTKWQDEESINLLGDLNKKALNEWNDTYGNLRSMYRTHYKRSDWDGPFDYEDGWNLVTLEHDWEGVYKTWIFPYAVGYIKQKEAWLNNYAPSVPKAVEEAFEFYTTNEKSHYYNTFEKGCFDKVWSKIYDAQNEYYYMAQDSIPRFRRMGTPLFGKYPTDNKPYSYQNGFMYNGYYKVFIAATQSKTYTIKKWGWNPDEQERNDLLLYWGIGLTVLMIIIVLPLTIIQIKHSKEKDEDLHTKLKRLCNPTNFISNGNYDKERVDKANEIYKRILETNPDNKVTLDEIQILAVSELGISLINKDKLNELKEKTNPKNYINPYNAEKIALANELYSIVIKENLTYNELEEVDRKSKLL